MSEFFQRARRVFFVISLKENLEIRQREKLRKTFKDFLYMPIPLTLVSLIITTRLKDDWHFFDSGLGSKNFRVRNLTRVYIYAVCTCFSSGAYFLCRFIKCVDDVYLENLRTHQITSHEARLVDDPDYFNSNTCLKYE